MASRGNPLGWDSVAVKRWLEEKFDFSEETLDLFIENDIDGQVLLEELDHDALKNEIGISSFGKRCKVLQEIRSLRDIAVRAQQDQEQGQATTTTVAPPVATKARSVLVKDLTAQPSDSTAMIVRGSDEVVEPQIGLIKLLDVPLRAWCGLPTDVEMEPNTTMEHFKDICRQDGDDIQNTWLDVTPQAFRESKQDHVGREAMISSAAQGHNNSVSSQRTHSLTLCAPMLLAPSFGSDKHPSTGAIAIVSTLDSTSSSPTPSSSTKVLAAGNKSPQRGKRTPKTASYLADIGVSLRSIFFNKDGDAFESDGEDDWTMIASRSNTKISNSGYRGIVQRNLRRVLRDPPIFDVPGYTVYAPLRRKEHDVPVKVLSVESPDQGVKVQISTWDAIFKDNKGTRSKGRLEVALDDQDLTRINFGAITGGVAGTQSPALPQPDDFVYPAYGDSDASAYTTDEELFKEVGREEKQRQNQAKTNVRRSPKAILAFDIVRELANKYISERQALWLTEDAPGAQARFDIYQRLARDREGSATYLESEIRQLSQERLKSMVDAIAETSYSTTDEAWRKFKVLDRTVDSLSFNQWKLDLLNGPVLTEPPESGADANSEAPSIEVISKRISSPGLPVRAISLSSADDGENRADLEEQEEELRQAELDKAFIDDSDMQIGFEQPMHYDESQEESEYDMDGDVIMKKRQASRRPGRTNTGGQKLSDEPPTRTGHQEKADEVSPSSLPTPPSTAATPNDTTLPLDPDLEDDLGDESDSIADRQMINNVDKNFEVMDVVDLGENTSASTVSGTPTSSSSSSEPAAVNKKEDRKARKKEERKARKKEERKVRKKEEKKSQKMDQGTDILESEMPKLHTKSSNAEGTESMEDPQPSDHPNNGSSSESPEPEEDTPMVSIKEAMMPDWRLQLKDNDQLEQELRKIRKQLSLGLNIAPLEPYFSAYQEYVEWIELDCGDTISFREFLAWKDAGNNTKDYRQKAEEAAKVQALADKAAARAGRKEKRKLDARLKREKKEREVGEKGEKANKDQKGALNAIKTEDTPNSHSLKDRSKVSSNRTSEPIVIDSDTSSNGDYTANAGKRRTRPSKLTQKVGDGDTSSDNIGRRDKRKKPRSKTTPKIVESDTSSEDIAREDKQRKLRSKSSHEVIDSDTTSDSTTREVNQRQLRSRSNRVTSDNLKSDDNKRKVIESGESNDDSSSSQPRSILAFRRRIKMARHHFGDSMSEVSATEDESGSESSQPRRKGKGKVPPPMLDEAEEVLRLRKDAERNELELQKRIKEQELRGRIRASMGPLKEDEILINPGHKKTESGVAIPAFLARNLKPHQVDGIRFMWKNIVMFDNGCILAHSMGLGKTFQVVAFVYVLLREIQAGNKDIPKKLQAGRVLLLMPPTVLQNWIEEFKKWIPAQERHVVHVHRLPQKTPTFSARTAVMEEWYSGGGVLLMGYNLFRELNSPPKRTVPTPPSILERYRQLLLSPGPSLTFADEGHAIKGKEAKIALICKELKSDARVILTGYPLQNRLEEYWCMVDFIRPNYLGNLLTFRHNYISPIEHGLYPESTYFEKKISAKKLKVLTELIQNFVMRKDQAFLKATLPRKSELVISCALTEMQYSLYKSFLATLPPGEAAHRVLGNGQILLTICNHPAAFRATLNQTIRESQKAQVGLKVPGDAPTTANKGDRLTIVIGDDSDEDAIEQEIEHEAEEALIQNKVVISQHWSGDFIEQKSVDVNDVNNSNKVRILMDILKESRSLQDKVLVFTRSIPTLDYLEYVTGEAGFRSLKLDGKTPMMDRQDMIDEFNRSDKYDLFLISSGAGSQGVNLVSANRVVIFDVGWNPSHDEQAIARAYRFGQKKPVFVYRLQTHDTWESKLYKTNLHKMNLSKRVVDKKNMAKDFSRTEMKSYYKLPLPLSETPKWATEEHIDELLQAVKTDDPVLKAILDREKDVLTSILLQSDLVREEVSDLTEADLAEIDNMIAEEQLRIQGIANPALAVPTQPVKVPLALQPVSILNTPKPPTQPRAQNATHVAVARAQEAALAQARLRYMARNDQGGAASTGPPVANGPRPGGPPNMAGAAVMSAAKRFPPPVPAVPGYMGSSITPLHAIQHVPGYHSYLNYPPPPINNPRPTVNHPPPPTHGTPPQLSGPGDARSSTADRRQVPPSGSSTDEAPTLRGFLQQLDP